ncbi:MAG: LysR family transcriptional regulator [Mesorhizobium sp.]|uniref:LysR family transcriptional regulator n=1 Tax=Mesorhizobium sp. TaxID=1871066 RepID=UPI000FE87252|nr:LysR family transcriptional regulator [Mesorhizobium sp.]RWQ39891.1 MAG: LysR family transcriptional regulator [Mesorhizobium sp.]TIL24030.1 MAG: LysR family transcriptional regulator [Mesorhizobium sp.]
MQEPALATNRVNLKLLQTFLLVAENNSFREAADLVSRSQSAVSTQIKQLEEQVGVALFHRTTRKVKLTAEGLQLLDNARRAVNEIELGLRNLREVADMKRGRVALACAPTLAATRLPRILAAFEKEYSGVKIVLQELKSSELFQSVRSGDVDFGIGPVVGDGDFEFEPIIAEAIHALVPRQYIRTKQSEITLAQLAELPIIQFHAATVMAQLVAEAARTHGLVLNTRYQCIQGQTLVALAEAGLGATILTGSVARTARSDTVQKMLIVEPTITQHFGIVRMRGNMLSPAAARLVELIRSMTREDAGISAPKRRRPKIINKTE